MIEMLPTHASAVATARVEGRMSESRSRKAEVGGLEGRLTWNEED